MKVFINSLPKSGTHLVSKFMDLLGQKLRKDPVFSLATLWYGFNPVRNIHKFLTRYCFFFRKTRGVNFDIYNDSESVLLSFTKKELQRINDDEYVCGHLPYSKKLADLLFADDYKVIHIIRNPRDVAVSFVNYSLDKDFWYADEFKKYNMMQDKIIALLKGMKKRFFYIKGCRAFQFNAVADIRQGVNNCSGWLQDERVCFVRFEDLIGPKGGGDSAVQEKTIKRILAYLEIEVTDEKVETIKESIYDKNAKTFSKGQIDSWKEVFNEEVEKVYRTEVLDKAKQFGYK